MQLTVFFVACLLGVALGKKNGPGQMCTSCNKARDSEEACNNQDIEGGNEKQCKDNQVCTTDVRCDGQGRLYFIKGCEKAAKITAANTLICNDDFTRCNYHCDQGDFCNLNAPPAVWESLVCYSTPTTAPTTTPEPPTTPDGVPCECQVSGDPLIQSFNAVRLLILAEQTTLLSTWDAAPDDPCKFKVTAHSRWSSGGDSLFIDQVSISYGVGVAHNEAVFQETAVIGCDDVTVRVAGAGPVAVTMPYTFTTSDSLTAVRVDRTNSTVHVTSDTCSYALDVSFDAVDCRDADVLLTVGEEYATRADGASLEGICGECDGDQTYETCFTHEDVKEEGDKYHVISDSCEDDTPMPSDAAECLVDGDPMIQTYSGIRRLILDNQKTLLSEWDLDPEDPCKFRIHARTDDFGGMLYVDMVEFSFGVHPSRADWYDLRVTIGCNSVTVMGQEYFGQMVDPPVTFVSSDGQTSVKVTVSDGTTHVTSTTCPYALHVTFDSDNCEASMTQIQVGTKYLPTDDTTWGMEGICGNGRHDPSLAYVTCFMHEDVSEHADHFRLISDSCQDGIHDNGAKHPVNWSSGFSS